MRYMKMNKFDEIYNLIIKESESTMDKDDIPIIEDDNEPYTQLSKNDLRKELAERQKGGELLGWTIDDYIEEMTGKNGQCHWIGDSNFKNNHEDENDLS